MGRDALDRARAFFKEKEFEKALTQYEYFFDHALEDDEGQYGVRLSYCLDEWARLGAKYEPALQRLQQRAEQASVMLRETRLPEHFHDYMAICGYLKRGDDAINLFLELHASDRQLAESIVGYIWDELVEGERWSVCLSYLPDPKSSYAAAVTKFDHAMEVCNSEPSLGGEKFEERIKRWYVRDVVNIVRVLKNNGLESHALAIVSAAESDMRTRGRLDVIARVNERIAQ